MAADDGSTVTPDDLALHHTIGAPRLSPDGATAVYAVASLDPDQDTRESRLHLLDLTSGEDRVLTHGPKDGGPRWSPDGRLIAFTRAGEDDDATPQLAVIDPTGGEARVLTAVSEGVGGPRWSPDGDTVVVASRRWRDGEPDAEDRDRRPRRITSLNYRFDDEGWLHDKVRRLYAVDVTAALARPPDEGPSEDDLTALTPDDRDAESAIVTADGAVLFTSPRQESWETDGAAGIWRAALDGSGTDPDRLEQVVAPGWWTTLESAPDGSALVVGHHDPLSWPAPPRLFRLGEDGLDELAPDLDRDPDAGLVGLDDGDVLMGVQDRGSVQLRRFAGDGTGETATVLGGARTVVAFDASGDGSRVVAAVSHPEDPGELWLVDEGEDPRVLTAHNAELRDTLLPVRHMTFERDGVEIDAWVLLPEGEERVPLLVNIHGGPTTQYGHVFFDEFQVYAAAGYAVVGANPRGSSGRGIEWATSVVGAWGQEDSVDVLDLEAVADAAVASSKRIDPDRIGIMGGSYGGYVTARLLARSDRYGSAVVERGLLDWVSFSGTSDIGAYFDRMFLDASLEEDVTTHWAASPVRTASRITTPTLVVHSFEDHRCPPNQGIAFFSALRRAGTDSELLLFPGEGHELSRSGSPKHRVERFEAILDWHDRHLDVDRA